MNTKINLSVIINGLEAVDDETSAFYDTETGETILYNDDWDNDVDADELEDERYMPLLDRFEINEYHMMEAYAYNHSDEHPELMQAIQGRKAFRRFKDAVADAGIEADWYEFRDNCYRSRAIEWCDYHKVEFEDDTGLDGDEDEEE